jgi:GT2 family glycosyltransferase
MAETRRRDTTRREQPIETIPAPQPERVEEPPEPKVSAILVAYNQAPALRRAIEALERSQGREALEILVVDCGSQDESSQLDTEYPAVTMLRLPHHLGATKAMNIGTRTAKGEFVLYMSPLVEVEPNTVASLAARLEEDAAVTVVCPLLLDAEGKPASRRSKMPTAEAFAAVCGGQPLAGADIDLSQEDVAIEYPGRDAIMVRKQFVKGMNYFDERFGQYWAEADLAMQIHRAQKKIRLYPLIRATYRAEPDPLAGDELAAADCALGAAMFLRKYNGFFAGLQFRIVAILKALVQFNFSRLGALISGQKLDGSQVG